MTTSINRNLHIPIARHAETGGAVTVSHALRAAPPLIRPDDLPREERVAFIIDAWRKGLWTGDIYTQGDPITLERAIELIREGEHEDAARLETTALRALEMLREDIETARSDPGSKP